MSDSEAQANELLVLDSIYGNKVLTLSEEGNLRTGIFLATVETSQQFVITSCSTG